MRSRWARKPVYDELLRKFPNTLIGTSGPAVGLPDGQMGNSEVGHMNIGAGRVVRMDITKIDVLVANKQLDEVPLFKQAMERGRERQLHFLGLLSDGGVHSHIEHLFCVAGDGEAASRGKSLRALFYWTGGTHLRIAARSSCRGCNRRYGNWAWAKIATVVGPLLRDGPRQPVGTHRTRVPRNGARPCNAPKA